MTDRVTRLSDQQVGEALNGKSAAIAIAAVVVVVIAAKLNTAPDLMAASDPGNRVAVVPRGRRDALVPVGVVTDGERAGDGDQRDVPVVGRIETLHPNVLEQHGRVRNHHAQHARNSHAGFVDQAVRKDVRIGQAEDAALEVLGGTEAGNVGAAERLIGGLVGDQCLEGQVVLRAKLVVDVGNVLILVES